MNDSKAISRSKRLLLALGQRLRRLFLAAVDLYAALVVIYLLLRSMFGDRRGPTAVLRSVAKMDHARTGGTLLNQKFTPQLLQDESGLDKLVQLIRTYFKLEGHHVQFNVVDAATLRAAQANPEQYRDLIVRVAGYSDYFCDLGQALQEEIIARTEHQSFGS